jgi:hypothetical protein
MFPISIFQSIGRFKAETQARPSSVRLPQSAESRFVCQAQSLAQVIRLLPWNVCLGTLNDLAFRHFPEPTAVSRIAVSTLTFKVGTTNGM